MSVWFQNDGLVRVNGDSIIEDTRERPVRSVSFIPKAASPGPQPVSEISEAQECTQTSSIQKPEPVKGESDSHLSPAKQSTEDEASKTLPDSELTGWRLFCLFGYVFSSCCKYIYMYYIINVYIRVSKHSSECKVKYKREVLLKSNFA